MGRTIPTFRRMLDRLEREWRAYAAVLRAREQEAFEALWSQARRHAAASTNQAPLEPLDAALMSMLLEHELRIARLERAAGRKEEPPMEQDADRTKEPDHADGEDPDDNDAPDAPPP